MLVYEESEYLFVQLPRSVIMDRDEEQVYLDVTGYKIVGLKEKVDAYV